MESGVEKIRSHILEKPLSDRHLERGVREAKRQGINVLGYVMIGMPEETARDVTITFMASAALRVDVIRTTLFCPFPGTRLWDYCEARRLRRNVELTDYFSASPLLWPSSHALWLDKIRTIFPWIMNCFVNGTTARFYQPLVSRVHRMSEEEWRREETRGWVRSRSRKLSDTPRERGVEHYFTAFEDRPDTAFLFAPRPQPIINVG